ncbi:exopolysaccharide biosynthesis protein [Erwinia sp. Ejp617]|nr:acyltransferase [Erwinia sp. Ejp617]ADP10993.1 exopolysaccharide biosynthesis protein [Erwinia sp. Ejp617]
MRNNYLQVSRGLASLIVCLHHLFVTPYFFYNASSQLSHSSLANLGDLSVSFFFALSGFVLIHSLEKNKVKPFGFITNRILRVYPEYILWTTIAVFIYSIYGNVLFNVNFYPRDLTEWIYTYTLIPLFAKKDFAMVSGTSWSLVYEMYFYVLLFFTLFFVKKIKQIPLILTITFFFLSYMGSQYFHTDKGGWVYYPYIISDFNCLSFSFGMIVYYFKNKFEFSLFSALSIIFSILIVFILTGSTDTSHVNYVFISTFILFFVTNIRQVNSTSLVGKKLLSCAIFLGDSSYTLYITHLLYAKLAWAIISMGHYVLAVILNIFVILIACVKYQYIGKPLNSFVKKWQIKANSHLRFYHF